MNCRVSIRINTDSLISPPAGIYLDHVLCSLKEIRALWTTEYQPLVHSASETGSLFQGHTHPHSINKTHRTDEIGKVNDRNRVQT
jgi:hypothetical protein